MVHRQKNNSYIGFGLSIASDLFLPELIHQDHSNKPDLSIEKANLTDLWKKEARANRSFIIREDFCLFRIPEVAIYFVEKGESIRYHPLSDVTEERLRLYILGTCMGALLFQKKVLPLHGSALLIDGKAYAIVGESGAGKSTLASAFIKDGHKLLSDDVIPVTFSDEGVPMVTPAYPQQKLWQQSLNEFGMNSKEYKPIFGREEKFTVPVKEHFHDQIVPLAGVIELTKNNSTQIQMEPVPILKRLSKLYQHTYRNFMIERLGITDWHFQLSAKLLSHIDLLHLNRPENSFTADPLREMILSTIYKEEVIL
ncbi:aldolase [Halobacillus rhizosphaerae]|uniref:HPr kinase/phosphorylase n=1 Tax=Halobacillus rhizosphaerae TaxID=3064889 RepID=UPI00398ADDA9